MEVDWTAALLSLGVGLGLASAAGLRVFVPLLLLGIAASLGWLPLTSGFEWLTSGPALTALAVATILENQRLLHSVGGQSARPAGGSPRSRRRHPCYGSRDHRAAARDSLGTRHRRRWRNGGARAGAYVICAAQEHGDNGRRGQLNPCDAGTARFTVDISCRHRPAGGRAPVRFRRRARCPPGRATALSTLDCDYGAAVTRLAASGSRRTRALRARRSARASGNDEPGSRKAARTTWAFVPPTAATMTSSAAASVGNVSVNRRAGGLGAAVSAATH